MNTIDQYTPRVIFFQVRDATSKLNFLTQTVQHHFLKKEKIILFAEDEKALHFADELLWKSPSESLLPHAILATPSDEWIALTKEKINLNQARIAFNLCSTPLLIDGPFRTIYEFEDASSPNKKMLSQIRFEGYKQARYSIESRLEF
jgi:DNA polymerase IIIc chi subunit